MNVYRAGFGVGRLGRLPDGDRIFAAALDLACFESALVRLPGHHFDGGQPPRRPYGAAQNGCAVTGCRPDIPAGLLQMLRHRDEPRSAHAPGRGNCDPPAAVRLGPVGGSGLSRR